MSEPFDPFFFDEEEQKSFSTPLSQACELSNDAFTPKKKMHQNPKQHRPKKKNDQLSPATLIQDASLLKPIPPRLNVKLSLHEEVSSSEIMDAGKSNGDVSLSMLSVEGRITAQVESTDANNNSAFCLKLLGYMANLASIKCHDFCILQNDSASMRNDKSSEDEYENRRTISCLVDIPKSKVEGCEIITYSMNVKTQNMPILVQSKATLKRKKTCRIGVQIRSNLNNQGDLSDFTVVLAIPSTLQGSSIKIMQGDSGVWDEIKRVVTWKFGHLPHGKSRLFSVEAEISSSLASQLTSLSGQDEESDLANMIQFPVLVRCSSSVDQISDLTLSAVPLLAKPASIFVQLTKSFRLLHRTEK